MIEPGSEASFLAPQPVKALPGVGPKTAAVLEQLGARLIGDLMDPRLEPALRRLWGSRLAGLQALACGLDHDPVVPDRDRKSLSHETTFDEDTNDLALLERTAHEFLGILAHELRLEHLAAGSFTVKLKDARFSVSTRQRHFAHPLNYDPPMWRDIQPALRALAVPGARYRLVGLVLSDLVPATDDLFAQRTTKALAAMDQLIERFGAGVVRLGGLPNA